jgi:hypothetical protein
MPDQFSTPNLGRLVVLPRKASKRPGPHPEHLYPPHLPFRTSICPLSYPYSTSASDVHSRMLEPGRSIPFRLSQGHGAVLVTKYPTLREDIQRTGTFEKYIKEHYASWVEFASATGHGNINPILVTGIDRTKDFAMISYSNEDDDDDDMRSEFVTSVPGEASAWGSWHITGFIHTNCGPQLYSPPPTRIPSPIPSDNKDAEPVSDEYDQSVFVRYYTMRKRLGIPKVIKAGAGHHDLGPGGREGEGLSEEEYKFASDPNSDTALDLCRDYGGNDASSVTSIESEPDVLIHNTVTVRSWQGFSTYSRLF